jgi:F0F1-type ATP synthase assembly protein I
MMLNLYVQQHQWIVIALLAGMALMLVFCLSYLALWRPRRYPGQSTVPKAGVTVSFLSGVKNFVPLVLIVLAVASVSFTIATVLAKSCRPPNW